MTESSLRIAVHGAAGRMGQRVVALCLADDEITLSAAIDNASHPKIGTDAGQLCGAGEAGIAIGPDLPPDVDVVIDFSLPEAVDGILQKCLQAKVPLVIATTGMTEDQKATIQTASEKIPVVMAPSMSMAVNLVMKLVSDAAAALKDNAAGVDVEIIERHHRFKEDAPSGTALHFGKLVAEQMGQTEHVHGRSGRPGQRPANEIGYHALRTGDNVGEHTIVFGLMGETIDLSVKGHTRDSYAYGAIAAAKFLNGKASGLYGMADVLNLN